MLKKINNIFYRANTRAAPIKNLLLELPMFKDFSRNEIHRLSLILYRRTWEAGETICAKGTPGNAFYIIREGEIRFRDSGLEVLTTGDYFGEAGLFIEARHAFDAVAERRTELLILFKQDFARFALRSPSAANSALFAFSRLLAERSLSPKEIIEAL